ncbi:MAG TPA: cytochrome c maturation protein CcmE [Rhodocyclaceae bacterium]|jgi:cytochrome c-type biogenesis protein CcmE|nr:cytochrome c maturation protein CcmE [Rhodocyclaceae bacterium]
MKPRQKRIAIIVGGLASLGLATYFVLKALDSNIALFYTPTQVAAGEAPKDRTFRIGGLVKVGTVQRNDMTVRFIVTDTAMEIPVAYTGILPDLFKEGKGVVAQGKMGADGQFVASEVLAKHDENYMPPEAQHAVDQAGKTAKTLK